MTTDGFIVRAGQRLASAVRQLGRVSGNVLSYSFEICDRSVATRLHSKPFS